MTQNSNSKVDEGAARKNLPTPEYYDAWERIFGKKGRQNEEQQEKCPEINHTELKSKKSK